MQTRQNLENAENILLLKRLNFVSVTSKCSTDERCNLLETFMQDEMPMAICTDIYSRAIDIPSIKVVINYDVPFHSATKRFDSKTYVYRMGRASRFGKYIHSRI